VLTVRVGVFRLERLPPCLLGGHGQEGVQVWIQSFDLREDCVDDFHG
jgi:hypothetical protein